MYEELPQHEMFGLSAADVEKENSSDWSTAACLAPLGKPEAYDTLIEAVSERRHQNRDFPTEYSEIDGNNKANDSLHIAKPEVNNSSEPHTYEEPHVYEMFNSSANDLQMNFGPASVAVLTQHSYCRVHKTLRTGSQANQTEKLLTRESGHNKMVTGTGTPATTELERSYCRVHKRLRTESRANQTEKLLTAESEHNEMVGTSSTTELERSYCKVHKMLHGRPKKETEATLPIQLGLEMKGDTEHEFEHSYCKVHKAHNTIKPGSLEKLTNSESILMTQPKLELKRSSSAACIASYSDAEVEHSYCRVDKKTYQVMETLV